jgi:hypothetical protein
MHGIIGVHLIHQPDLDPLAHAEQPVKAAPSGRGPIDHPILAVPHARAPISLVLEVRSRWIFEPR